ncbi:hypothetical protein ACOMHN_016581 [Nucella lapillus]
METMESMWPENRPDRLEIIATRFLAKNLPIIAEQGKPRLPLGEDTMDCTASAAERDEYSLDATDFEANRGVDPEITTCYHIRSGVCLNRSICDRLLAALSEDTEEVKEMTYEKLSVFADSEVTRLGRADLRSVADHSLEMGLKMISGQPLTELIMPCVWRCLPIIKRLQKLCVLRLEKEPMTNAVDAFIQGQHNTDSWETMGSEGNALFPMDEDYYKLTCPNLRCLVLHNLQFRASPARDLSFNSMVVSNLLRPLVKLTHLSLSMCRVSLEELTCLGNLTQLVNLNLSNIKVNDFGVVVKMFRQLRNLHHLDLSQGDEDLNPVMYPHVDCMLKAIVDALPKLHSLDISGTNLAGFEAVEAISHRLNASKKKLRLKEDEEDSKEEKGQKCSIPGLENRHLEFLGLYGCAYNACKRKHIPANKVTGDADSMQIVLAVQRYVDNHFLLTRALNDLFSLFRFTSVHNHRQALEVSLVGGGGVLAAMKMYPSDSSIQIAGSASLFYIAKGDHKQHITHQHKRQIVNLLLAAMYEHCFDQTMMRNASLTLCHLNLPSDVMFCYERLVKQLLDMLKYDYRDEFIHRLGIFLLNCLACQVDGKEKELVGKLGAIETMLQIISRKVRMGECDDVLEVAWSTLWNVTDETSSNCQKFLTKGGMQLFVACLQKFPDKPELLRNMMGLMGNIAEVDSLRKNLMVDEYVEIFSDLLQSESDGIEVSYNACGVLSHLCFDGPHAWTLQRPSRLTVMNRMQAAIARWPLKSKRNINYRSFEPILRLVNHQETPIVQYWSCWALCNLTTVSLNKYCRLLESGKGRKTLERVSADPQTREHVRRLVRRTLNKMDKARSRGYDLEDCESDDDDDENIVPDQMEEGAEGGVEEEEEVYFEMYEEEVEAVDEPFHDVQFVEEEEGGEEEESQHDDMEV